jgi:putative tricarboxylic transport membrane protein
VKTDRFIVVCILLLAVAYWFAIHQIREPLIGDPIGPRAIPKLLAIGLVISAVLLWFETVAKKKSDTARAQRRTENVPTVEASEVQKLEEKQAVQEPASRPMFLVSIIGGTLVYFFLFNRLGYALSTAAYLFALMMLFNRGKTQANLLTAVGFSLGSYLAFTRLFGAQLPAGLLPF